MARNETASAQGGLRPARRTIVKGAAWAVPAIAIASPAFAATASSPDTGVSIQTASMCKHSGNSTDWCKTYHLYFCFKNDGPGPATVEVTEITITGEPGLPLITPGSFPIAEGATECVVVHMGPGTDSSNISGTIKFSVEREAGVVVEDFEPIAFSGANPCPNKVGPGGEPHPPVACTDSVVVEESKTTVDAKTTVEDSNKVSDAQPTTPAEPTEEDAEPTEDTSEVTSAPDVSTDESTENN